MARVDLVERRPLSGSRSGRRSGDHGLWNMESCLGVGADFFSEKTMKKRFFHVFVFVERRAKGQ